MRPQLLAAVERVGAREVDALVVVGAGVEAAGEEQARRDEEACEPESLDAPAHGVAGIGRETTITSPPSELFSQFVAIPIRYRASSGGDSST